jgi:hypothetical protein
MKVVPHFLIISLFLIASAPVSQAAHKGMGVNHVANISKNLSKKPNNDTLLSEGAVSDKKGLGCSILDPQC